MTPGGDIRIAALDDEFIPEVARIHGTELEYSVNSRLGQRHLEFLYRVMARDEQSHVAVAVLRQEAVGVISGTLDPIRLKSEFLRRLSPGRLAWMGLRLATSPDLIGRYRRAQQIAAPVHWQGQEVTAELTAVAVAPACRGRGVGRALVRSLEAYFKSRGVRTYRLDTLVINTVAAAFYQGLGFVEVARRADSIVYIRRISG